MPTRWRPDPPDGTSCCGGFDGSENNDWTAIKLETRDGYIFTPRYGPDRRPTIWNPAEWNGRIPRGEIRVAWAELAGRYRLRRVYCDPGFHDETSWESEIESCFGLVTSDDDALKRWALENGEKVFVPWPTTSAQRMFPAIRRFEADLRGGEISHDGCPVTTAHLRNCRKIAQRADRYTLGKPSLNQKIDTAVTAILAHEAAADERAAGWEELGPSIFFLPR